MGPGLRRDDGIRVKSRELTLAEQRMRQAWLFLAPMLIVLIVVAGWPLARTILFSLTDARLDNPSIWSFVGLSNYIYLFEDSLWWGSVLNTFIFAAISVTSAGATRVALASTSSTSRRRGASGERSASL